MQRVQLEFSHMVWGWIKGKSYILEKVLYHVLLQNWLDFWPGSFFFSNFQEIVPWNKSTDLTVPPLDHLANTWKITSNLDVSFSWPNQGLVWFLSTLVDCHKLDEKYAKGNGKFKIRFQGYCCRSWLLLKMSNFIKNILATALNDLRHVITMINLWKSPRW